MEFAKIAGIFNPSGLLSTIVKVGFDKINFTRFSE
jgi:hypothetical protein